MTQPEKRIRCGSCEVAIFENEITTKSGKKEKIKKVSFQKRYKDPGGEWKSTQSFDIADIPKARLALDEAYKYLVLSRETE